MQWQIETSNIQWAYCWKSKRREGCTYTDIKTSPRLVSLEHSPSFCTAWTLVDSTAPSVTAASSNRQASSFSSLTYFFHHELNIYHLHCLHPQNKVSGFWTWLFTLSKMPELGDTVFIVLRKQQLIFLHWSVKEGRRGEGKEGRREGGKEGRLGKNELHELRGVQYFKRYSAKFVNFSAKFGSLNIQIRNNLKNIIFISCK